ncbi:head GIN domain-containing protein [Lutibacter flavus]|uniref:Putative auto-transporter adhesin, head GIN domain n=1 Tax=Lutibacter flavus TaxID=691689 RepID=A0A238VYF3_9FLAO|nr:head GIN domain-containing protein [Lutibacter flavus]SNR38883.1 Putative auto-transporter adhesin, head GIN domain [Lutibacter flavus]
MNFLNQNRTKKSKPFTIKTIASVIAFLIISTSINAQFFNKKINGNGDIITKTRSVGDYDKIGVSGSFDVKLYKGNEGKITIKADENLMEYIVTEVKNGNLEIKPKKGYNIRSRKTIEITVPFEDIKAVSLAGSGDVYTTDVIKSSELKLSLAGSGNIDLNVDTSDLDSSIAGSGNIKLNGKAKEFSCSIAGSGNLNGSDLKASIAKAKIAGSGNIKINAVNEIHAKIAGSGNIIYSGDPDIVKSNSAGSGSVRKKN